MAETNRLGQSRSFVDNDGGYLTRLIDRRSGASYDYQYDALGRRTSASIDSTVDFVNTYTYTYTYDALHRMVRIEQSSVTGGNAVAEERIDLRCDAASQWQTITSCADLAGAELVATSEYTFDAAGRLTAPTDAEYDQILEDERLRKHG